MDSILENLKNNKKIIIFCVVLIVTGLTIFLYSDNKERFQVEEYYQEEVIKKYEANSYIPVYVTENDMANKYLNDFKNLLFSDINEAYDILNNNYKKKKFGNLDSFSNYVADLLSVSVYSMKVDKFSVNRNNGYKFYYIKTSSGETFIFKEISIMNYEVFLDDYTVEIK